MDEPNLPLSGVVADIIFVYVRVLVPICARPADWSAFRGRQLTAEIGVLGSMSSQEKEEEALHI